MNRREMLKRSGMGIAGAAAGAVMLPRLLGQDFNPQQFRPPTCQMEGLTGTWPNCSVPYRGEWLNMNPTILNNHKQAFIQFWNGCYNRISA